jgi:hypothetical protein
VDEFVRSSGFFAAEHTMSETETIRVFLSSTFSDLTAERKAVENVIHRMDDFFDGMEYFGSFPDSPLQMCLSRVRTADIIVLVLGFRHGFVPRLSVSYWLSHVPFFKRIVPRTNNRSMVEHEYYEAIENEIPVLAYVADREAYAPSGRIDPRILAFREILREQQGVPCYRSPDDLATQVAADLARETRRISTRLEREHNTGLVARHNRVIDTMRQGRFKDAQLLNENILADHRYSPRARYNQACILSRIAESMPDLQKKAQMLDQARHHLEEAIKLGILRFILFYADRNDPNNSDPPARIINDPDLKELFADSPSLVSSVQNGFVPVNVKYGCGC